MNEVNCARGISQLLGLCRDEKRVAMCEFVQIVLQFVQGEHRERRAAKNFRQEIYL